MTNHDSHANSNRHIQPPPARESHKNCAGKHRESHPHIRACILSIAQQNFSFASSSQVGPLFHRFSMFVKLFRETYEMSHLRAFCFQITRRASIKFYGHQDAPDQLQSSSLMARIVSRLFEIRRTLAEPNRTLLRSCVIKTTTMIYVHATASQSRGG